VLNILYRAAMSQQSSTENNNLKKLESARGRVDLCAGTEPVVGRPRTVPEWFRIFESILTNFD